MPKPTIIIFGSLALLLLIGAGVTIAKFFLVTGTHYEVIIFNEAKEAISQGEVRALSKKYGFQRLAAGEMTKIVIWARGEGGYVIDVLLQSGRRLSSAEFYLTGGFIISDVVRIQDGNITLLERNVK